MRRKLLIGDSMNNSGESEFSNLIGKGQSMKFWQIFFLTLFGATGLMSLVADGPHWITYPSFIFVIALLFPLAIESKKKKS